MDYFEYNEHEADSLVYAFSAMIEREERRQRRRRAIGLAVLCVSFCAVVAVSWWLS